MKFGGGPVRVSLREAIPTDLTLLTDMVCDLYSSDGLHSIDPAHVIRTMTFLAENPGSGSIYLIYSQDDIAGYTIVVNWWSNEYGGKAALLDELYITPRWRGKGLGKLVMESVEEKCREAGIPVIYLEVEPSNTRAKRFYDFLGFDESSRAHMKKRLR